MGQQQSKKTKKNGKDKEKDLAQDTATPPEGADNDGSPQGTHTSPSDPSAHGGEPNGVGNGNPAINVANPDGAVTALSGSGARPPGADGSPSANSTTANQSSSNPPSSVTSSPAGNRPTPLDIPVTQTILSNSTSPSSFPATPGSASFSAGDPGSLSGNGAAGGKGKVLSLDIDDMIQRLLDVGYTGKVSKSLCLKNTEIVAICQTAREVFLSQPTLIELSPPVKIVGDVHGQYSDLIRLFEMCGFPPAANYLFLGDYVDRGKQSLETILLLLCYKIKYPENFFLLRGNHECANVTRGMLFNSSQFKGDRSLRFQFTAFTTNASDGVISRLGRRLSMSSTVYPSLP